ncbi:ATP-binding protein [Cellulosimicrobium funkei]
MSAPETAITADLVREALTEQHPDLAGLPLREVAGGWGNQMWRLGDDLAVRVQRMDPTPELQLKERRWLPVLAPRLPLPVPTPVRHGEPSARLPRHWTVMTWVPGEPLDHGTITRGEHAAPASGSRRRATRHRRPATRYSSSSSCASLVENAERYNLRHDGWVRVTTRSDAAGDAVLEVVNPGPPVAPDDLPGLFEPFRRLGGERTGDGAGSGLGLSIVRAVVDAHGGSVTLAARPEGGLVVTVRLPGEVYDEVSASPRLG